MYPLLTMICLKLMRIISQNWKNRRAHQEGHCLNLYRVKVYTTRHGFGLNPKYLLVFSFNLSTLSILEIVRICFLYFPTLFLVILLDSIILAPSKIPNLQLIIFNYYE